MSGSDEHSSPGPSQNRRTPDRFSSDSFDRDVEVDDAKRALLEPSECDVETTLKPIGRERRDSHSSGRRSIKRKSNVEFVREMLVETLPTLVLSTIGLTITGELVEVIANWRAMARIDELFILIPVLNNMKGNLEMNLSSRLGTAAYLGVLDTRSSRQSIISGNIFLLQLQALLISSLAGCFSFILSWISRKAEGKLFNAASPAAQTVKRAILWARDDLRKKKIPRLKPIPNHEQPGFKEFIFVVCTSMSAASVSALSLGTFMCTLVIVCRRYNVNPDNVAPPIASALGDLITLFLLATISTIFLPLLPTLWPLLIVLVLLVVVCGAGYLSSLNAHVKPLLREGWTPLIGAMLITSFSGLVLDQFVNRYDGYGLLAIVITGLPGGVGSIFISRISTLLHASSPQSLPGLNTKLSNPVITSVAELEERLPLRLSSEDGEPDLEEQASQNANQPHGRAHFHPSSELAGADGLMGPSVRLDREPESERLFLFAGTLFAITFPVQILFLLFVHYSGWVQLSWTFVIVFMILFSASVLASLSLAKWLTHFLWSKGLDPDMYAMPIQSSLVDLMGQCLLVLSYEIAKLLGSEMLARDPR